MLIKWYLCKLVFGYCDIKKACFRIGREAGFYYVNDIMSMELCKSAFSLSQPVSTIQEPSTLSTRTQVLPEGMDTGTSRSQAPRSFTSSSRPLLV